MEKPAWKFLVKENLAKQEILQQMTYALLDTLFRIPANLEQPDKPKQTNSDASILQAKQKIFVNFENNAAEPSKDLKFVLRIRVPFLSQEEIEEEKKIELEKQQQLQHQEN